MYYRTTLVLNREVIKLRSCLCGLGNTVNSTERMKPFLDNASLYVPDESFGHDMVAYSS
jgi:hypothetical protein